MSTILTWNSFHVNLCRYVILLKKIGVEIRTWKLEFSIGQTATFYIHFFFLWNLNLHSFKIEKYSNKFNSGHCIWYQKCKQKHGLNFDYDKLQKIVSWLINTKNETITKHLFNISISFKGKKRTHDFCWKLVHLSLQIVLCCHSHRYQLQENIK